MAHPVRGDRGEAERVHQVQECPVAPFLRTPPVALHVDRDVLGAELLEYPGQSIRVGRLPEGLDPRKSDQAIDTTRQQLGGQSAGPLGDPFLHQGDQTTEVAVSLAALDEERQAPSSPERQLGADEGADARLLRSLEEAWSPRQRVAIDERQSRIVQLRGPGDQLLR